MPDPDQQQPTPKPRPEKPVHEPQNDPRDNPTGGEDTGGAEGTGSHGQQVESGVPEGRENAHTHGNGSAETPVQPEGYPGQGTTTVNEGGHLPAAVGTRPEGRSTGGGAGPESTTKNAPPDDGLSSDTGMMQHPDRRAASAALPGREPGSEARSTEGPSRRPAKAAVDTPAPHAAGARGEDPIRPAEDSSGPAQQVTGRSQVAGAPSPAAPTGGGRTPAGRAASEATLGSAEYFFGYLWDGGSFSVQQDGERFDLMRDGARGPVPATSRGGALTQRAPPLPIPSPFSGFSLTIGGAVFSASSSGDGHGPLFAVIVLCLSAVLWRGRSRAYGALLRAGTVPPLALERPG